MTGWIIFLLILIFALLCGLGLALHRLRLYKAGADQSTNEKFVRGIIDQSSDAIVLVNPQGLVSEWNPAAMALTGLQAAEVLGQPFWEVQHRLLPEQQRSAARLEELQQRTLDALRTGDASQLTASSIVHADGTLRYSQQSISLIETAAGDMLFSISRDVTEQKRAKEEQAEWIQRMQGQQAGLVELASHPAIASGAFASVVEAITETASAIIQVERVSVWLLDETCQELVCSDLYERTPQRHTMPGVLTAQDYPAYFEALQSGRAIDAHLARSDPRTSEFTSGYLVPLGIVSMLDAAIRLDGRMAGVLCFEHIGEPRRWTQDEIAFCASAADQVALALLNRARLQTEQRLLVSEEKFSKAYQSAPLAMIITRQADRRFLDVNDAFSQITGYARHEVLGRTAMDLDLWIDPEENARLIQEFALHERLSEVEFSFQRKSGEQRTGVLSAEIIDLNNERCVLTSLRDVTESKQAEISLRQYTQRLEILRMIDQAILGDYAPGESSPEAIVYSTLSNLQRLLTCPFSGVFSFDFPSRQTRLLAASGPAAERLLDCVVMEEYFLAEDLRSIQVIDQGRLADLLAVLPLQTDIEQVLTTQGIQSMLNVPLIAQGELIGALLLASDTPAYFNAERIEVASEVADMLAVAIQQARLSQQVQRQTEDLEERVQLRTAEMEAKNRELETFTYSVSHDLKAPLRGVDGYSRLLMEEYAGALDEEGRSFLLRIREGVIRMSQLIEDLLTYSKLEQRSLHKSQVYLPPIIDNLLVERSSEIQLRKIAVTTNISCHFVYAEAEGLSQALRNLFDNAIKFTRDASQPEIEIGGRVTSNSCVLWVKDNGIGFDMQYQGRIFEIFQRLNRMEEYPGTGVGLAIVRKAMQRMGGRVWAESAPGAGATFYLEMPEG